MNVCVCVCVCVLFVDVDVDTFAIWCPDMYYTCICVAYTLSSSMCQIPFTGLVLRRAHVTLGVVPAINEWFHAFCKTSKRVMCNATFVECDVHWVIQMRVPYFGE